MAGQASTRQVNPDNAISHNRLTRALIYAALIVFAIYYMLPLYVMVVNSFKPLAELQAGNVLGVYLHGLFEDPGVLHALFGAAAPTLDSVFDGLADFIDKNFEPGVLAGLLHAHP